MTDGDAGGSGSALKAMVSFFTVWQQDIDQNDMDRMEQNFHLVPIIGALFGLALIVAISVMLLIQEKVFFGGSLLIAAFILITVYAGSKFIHFDGLADFGDGMIVSGDPEKHVRALKDTLVGAGGVGVALAAVLLSFAVYGSVASYFLLLLAPMTEILVKNAMVSAAAFGKAGNGMAGRQVALTTTDSLMKSVVVSLVMGIVLLLLSSAIISSMNDMWSFKVLAMDGLWTLLIGTAVSVFAGYAMARIANRNFGMVNGDILGATNEIARPVVMLISAVAFYAMVL